jgi:hypothetical protein
MITLLRTYAGKYPTDEQTADAMQYLSQAGLMEGGNITQDGVDKVQAILTLMGHKPPKQTVTRLSAQDRASFLRNVQGPALSDVTKAVREELKQTTRRPVLKSSSLSRLGGQS